MLSENVERSKIIKLTWYLLSFFSKKRPINFFLKGQIVNISEVTDHEVSVLTTQLHYTSAKAANT